MTQRRWSAEPGYGKGSAHGNGGVSPAPAAGARGDGDRPRIAHGDDNRRPADGVGASEPLGARREELWEAAYTSLESPRAEIRRYKRRLRKLGVGQWRRDATIVELFCGRGNGLHALRDLGFTNLIGADLSATLLRMYRGPARLVQCDCRTLPFAAASVDAVIVLGGLHHLPGLPDDVAATLAEVRRVLRRDGWLLAIEPWLTPFLALVHWVCRLRLARRLWPKLATLATMIHYEQPTYDQWLAAPGVLAPLFERYVEVEHRSVRWGKLRLLGQKKAGWARSERALRAAASETGGRPGERPSRRLWHGSSADARGERRSMAAAGRAGAPASARVLAGIDIGTNTVRLLAVAPQPDGSWRIVDEARRITRLGEGAMPGRTLQAAAIQRTITAAGEFAERARLAEAGIIRVVATSAVREAANQADFLEAARRDRRLAGIAPRVIDAAEEARLTLAGVRRAVDFRHGLSLIVDIGGGSTEFTLTEGTRLVASTSCLLGVVGLTETHLTTAPTDAREYAGLLAAIDAQLDVVARALGPRRAARLIGTAGTITTLAALHLGLVVYDAATINATRLTLPRVHELLAWLKSLSLPERQAIAALEAGREDIIVSGAAIVARIMERFAFPELLVSDYGLREGLICAMVAEMTEGSG